MKFLPFLLLTPLLLATLPAPAANAANATDCTVGNYLIRDYSHKHRAVSFRYNPLGEPFMALETSEAAIRAAADTWTRQRNACGVADTTTVQYELGLVTSASPGHGNGRSEIWWSPCEGCLPSYSYFWNAGECDIVLNSTWGDSLGDALFHHPDILASILAREMGWCIGLADPGAGPMTTMNGGWCEDVFVRWFATQSCGLTLAKGDMDGLRVLWPL